LKKYEKYLELVKCRKECEDCTGLTNPSKHLGGIYDSNHMLILEEYIAVEILFLLHLMLMVRLYNHIHQVIE